MPVPSPASIRRALAAVAAVALAALVAAAPARARTRSSRSTAAPAHRSFSPAALRALLARPVAGPPVAGQVLIAEDAGHLSVDRAGALRASDPRLAARLATLGLDRGDELWQAGKVRFIRLESSRPEFDPAAAAADLNASGLVRAAMPNLRLRLFATLPNDPDLDQQWYVFDYGGFADVRLPDAWDLERGSAAVRIGIMDTGVDLTHPDLATKIWTNPGEIPGNGLDDDGDGYADDVHGWDFGNGDNDPNPHAVFDSTTGIDVGFHGTFVAGIAAAATDNAEGISGAGWNCSIVPLKVADSTGDITSAAVTAAFGYAAQQHIEVLNMSLGTGAAPGVAAYFQSLVDQATAAGVLCVASAGNDGTNSLNYPAACSGVLSVGATNESNLRSSFSNWGPWVRVAAPGEDLWSSICQNYVIDDYSQIIYLYYFIWDGVRPYMYGSGTSFSSPLAAGVCAMVRSRNPSWTPMQVEGHMVATGDVVAYDQPIGPKVNAARAVSQALAAVGGADPVASLRASPNPFAATASLRFALAQAAPVRVRVLDCAGRLVRELESSTLAAGPHALSWDGTDARGATVRAGLYFIELDRGTARECVRLVRLR